MGASFQVTPLAHPFFAEFGPRGDFALSGAEAEAVAAFFEEVELAGDVGFGHGFVKEDAVFAPDGIVVGVDNESRRGLGGYVLFVGVEIFHLLVGLLAEQSATRTGMRDAGV